VPEIGGLLGQRRRNVDGADVMYRQGPLPRDIVDPATLVRGRAREVERVRLEARCRHPAVEGQPGGDADDRRGVEPAAQERGDRGGAPETAPDRLPADLAETLRVLALRAVADLA